jgi:hypothetical protein
MSKIGMSKMSLLTKKTAYHIFFYGLILNQKNLFSYCNFFIFFCGKKLRVFYVAYLGENGNKNLEKKRNKIFL